MLPIHQSPEEPEFYGLVARITGLLPRAAASWTLARRLAAPVRGRARRAGRGARRLLAIRALKHGLCDAEKSVATHLLVTMHTFHGTPRFPHRHPRRSPRALIRSSAIGRRLTAIARARGAAAGSQPHLGAQDGFMLIEVVISAMLISLIAIATLSGFDSAGRASADQRAHAQATQLVQQDEERLRGLTTTELAQLGTKTQTVTENGTVFTITSSASFVSAAKETLTCEAAGGTADYIQTTSSARWPALGSRPAVSQSSIVSTPTSAALMVKVKNQNEEPVEGAGVTVTVASGKLPTAFTGSTGCVIFGALTPEKVKVAVSKANWVDKAGKFPPAEKEVTIVAKTLATSEVTIAPPGTIVAEFQSNGVFTEAIKSDTFFAYQGGVPPPPQFIGGKAGPPAVHEVELTGLFPFAEAKAPHNPELYTVYAGDCEANKPETVTAAGEKLKTPPNAAVEASKTTKVKVEVPTVKVTVYEGAKAEGAVLKEAELAMIINQECSAASAQNAAKVAYEHKVTIMNTGELEQRYQPYAKELKLCVVAKLAVKKYYKNTFLITNTKKAGSEFKFALKGAGKSEAAEAGKLKCP